MIERRPGLQILRHVILLIGVGIVAFPLYLTFIGSTQTAQQINQSVPMSMLPGGHFWETYRLTLFGGPNSQGSPLPAMWPMMQISLISALGIAIGKIAISLLSAFAIVYFRFPGRMFFFWAIFITLMLPVEVRIGPTYQVVADRGSSTSLKKRMGPAPSMRAASTSSSGMVRKNCRNKKVAVAEAISGTVRPAKLLSSPNPATTS